MPGTAADPVRLDHYQLIREVHWPEFTHAAFLLSIEILSNSTFQSCGGSDALPAGGFSPSYLTDSQYAFIAPSPFYTSLRGRKNGEWVDFDVGASISVTGLPSPGSPFSYASFIKVAGDSANVQLPDTWRAVGPEIRWKSALATHLDIPIPGSPTTFFENRTSATAQHFGDTFFGSDEFCISGALWHSCTSTHTTAPDPSGVHENASRYSDHDFNVAGVLVTVDSKQFQGVGLLAQEKEPLLDIHHFNDENRLWVLCERVPPTES